MVEERTAGRGPQTALAVSPRHDVRARGPGSPPGVGVNIHGYLAGAPCTGVRARLRSASVGGSVNRAFRDRRQRRHLRGPVLARGDGAPGLADPAPPRCRGRRHLGSLDGWGRRRGVRARPFTTIGIISATGVATPAWEAAPRHRPGPGARILPDVAPFAGHGGVGPDRRPGPPAPVACTRRRARYPDFPAMSPPWARASVGAMLMSVDLRPEVRR